MTRPEETTFLEDPATPAPIFAYRALRGLIFGSPDPNSSPERVVQSNNKENVSPRRLGTIAEVTEKANYTPRASPQKRKRATEKQPLSPSKGLAVPFSPTKGILRTPGISTPRAQALRDVNVKFRSLSPELTRKEVVHEIVVSEDATPKRQKLRQADTTIRTTRIARAFGEEKAPQITKDQQAKDEAKTNPTISFQNVDFESYQRRTEKEMRLLIKQGQKWKEYARIQDDENAKLRQLLEQAQKENERLERKLRLAEKGRSAGDTVDRVSTKEDMKSHQLHNVGTYGRATVRKSQTTNIDHTIQENKEKQREPMAKPTNTLLSPSKIRQSSNPKPIDDARTTTAPPTSRSLSDSLETRLSQLRQSSVPPLTSSFQPLPTRPPRPPIATTTLPTTIHKPLSVPSHLPSTFTSLTKPPTYPSPLTTLAQKLEPLPSPHTSTRTNLAPERYSAARQRLRQRQQARKASALSGVVEESNIDWVGIA